MDDERLYAVGALAELAGVSVRTLHHYDEIGLVRPSARTSAGHRRYAAADADRLADVLGYRELEFALEDIQAILDDPRTDPTDRLRRQRTALAAKRDRLDRIIDALDTTLEARNMGTTGLTPEEKLEVFGDFDPDRYEDEVRERWGSTDAYRQSAARTKRYTKEDWTRIAAELESIEHDLATALESGADAGSTAAMDLAERARRHIEGNYYDCPPAMHRNLGDMYVADERFRAHYDDRSPGLAQFVRDAIHANADRADADRDDAAEA